MSCLVENKHIGGQWKLESTQWLALSKLPPFLALPGADAILLAVELFELGKAHWNEQRDIGEGTLLLSAGQLSMCSM